MSSDRPVLLDCEAIGKAYRVYRRPEDRLLELLSPHRTPRHDLHWALRDVGFEVRRGESVAIVGRNGAGKSTLLQSLCGVLEPTQGRVRVAQGCRIVPLLGLGAGLNPDFTGIENIRLIAALFGLPSRRVRELLPEIVRFAELGDFMDLPVRTYSSGMQSRLAFAVAVHSDPDLLLVDETLAVGDSGFVQKCMRWVRSFLGRGTLVLVSHSAQLVMDLCDRAIWIDEGRIRRDGPARDVSMEYSAFMHALATGSSTMRIRPARLPDPPERAPSSEGRSRSHAAESDVRDATLRNLHLDAVTVAQAFDWRGPEHGEGKASVVSVCLVDPRSGEAIRAVGGGEIVEVRVVAEVHERIERPVIGYIVRNSRGLEILGENSFLLPDEEIPPAVGPGRKLTARFRFRWPYLRSGRFFVTAAIASGRPDRFVQQHRLEEALVLDVGGSHVVYAEFAPPLLHLSLEVDSSGEPIGGALGDAVEFGNASSPAGPSGAGRRADP